MCVCIRRDVLLVSKTCLLLSHAIIQGLMPPVMESASEDGEADREEDQDEVDLYDTADEGGGDEGTKVDVAARRTTTGQNDSVVHRSPSPSSACHSLEWDSNGDDFFGHDCRPHNIKSFSS